jgi:hypothetical protein
MRKIILTGLLAVVLNVSAQTDPNRIYRKHFFWGIAFTGTYAKSKMNLDPVFWQRQDSIAAIRPGGQAGGGFGGSVAYRFGRNWELKTLTMLQLHQRDLQYQWRHGPGPTIKMETISFDLPLTLKYRSSLHGNKRFYVLGGMRWSYDFQSNEDLIIGVNKPLVALKKNTFYYEYGAGWEFQLDFVDLSLELKMSNGINNGLANKIPDSYYSGSIQSLFPRLFSLSLMAQN